MSRRNILPPYSALEMAAISSFETYVNIYRTRGVIKQKTRNQDFHRKKKTEPYVLIVKYSFLCGSLPFCNILACFHNLENDVI